MPTCGWGGGRHRSPSYDEMVSAENLFAAWNKFVKGKRNRLDVLGYEQYLEDRMFDLHDRLALGVWEHGPYETFTVCDPKPRVIHKASVEDRIVHHALVQVIEPVFDRSFIFDSWSCREKKGTHAAVARLQSQLRKLKQQTRGPIWILKVDIRRYFASVDQDVLLALIGRRIRDSRLMGLVRGIVHSHKPGLPLGNLTSQLFANVYLDPLDHFVKEQLRSSVYLRYCDDFILASTSRDVLVRRLSSISRYLQESLHLGLHPNKIVLKPWHQGIDWLGAVVYPDRVMMRATTKQRMRKNLDGLVWKYLDRTVGAMQLRSTFASYDGLLCGVDEGDLKAFYRVLYRCL